MYTVLCGFPKPVNHPNFPVFFICLCAGRCSEPAAASSHAPGFFTPLKIIIALFCVIFHAAISEGVLKVHSSVMSHFMSHVKDHHIDSTRVTAGCQLLHCALRCHQFLIIYLSEKGSFLTQKSILE